MVLAPEKLLPGQNEGDSVLKTRIENPDQLPRSPDDEEQLGKILERIQRVPSATSITDEDTGEEVLVPTGFLPVADISFTEESAKRAWHAPIVDALRWLVELWNRTKIINGKKQEQD